MPASNCQHNGSTTTLLRHSATLMHHGPQGQQQADVNNVYAMFPCSHLLETFWRSQVQKNTDSAVLKRNLTGNDKASQHGELLFASQAPGNGCGYKSTTVVEH
jgi:hypothetical protein